MGSVADRLWFHGWDPGALFLGRDVKQGTELHVKCLKDEKTQDWRQETK